MSSDSGSFVMAVDIGFTNLQVALVDRNGAIHQHIDRPVPKECEIDQLSKLISDLCHQLLDSFRIKANDLVAVGCSAPGSVNPETGVVVTSSLRNWMGVEIRTSVEKAIGRPVSVEGDGAATTMGYYTFGPTRGHDPLMGLNIGTGISGGFIINGQLLRGSGHAAFEVGHIPLFRQGRFCSCGRQGCWEAHSSGSALRNLLHEYRLAGYRLPILPEDLNELACSGNQTAINIWEEQGNTLGLGIAMLLNMFNPKTVVLGGGLVKAWSLYKKSLLKTAREKALPRNAQSAILCGPYPEKAALLGAAVCAIRDQGPVGFFVDPKTDPA